MSEGDSRWQILLTRQAEKALYRLSRSLLQKFDRALLALAENPHPSESRLLPGHDNLYRLAVDGWRLIYSIEEDRLVILVLEIAPKQQPERYRLEEEGEGLVTEELPQQDESVTPASIDLPRQAFEFTKFRTMENFSYQTSSLLKQIRRQKIRLLRIVN